MMRLFGMECKKITKSILYWALILALLAVSLFRYEPAVESELRRTNDPASVFYIAPDGGYAKERNSVPDEAMEDAMMAGATNRLINNYRSNRYEYYPFGYVKEKTMSTQEQAVILQYLTELTSLSKQALAGATDETGDTNTGNIPISGGGAFVLEPGQGNINESGQFIINPEDWQYVENTASHSKKSNENKSRYTARLSDRQLVENETAPSETPSRSSNSLAIQASFERFKEIMKEVNRLIGRNSYFSRTMLTLY